MTPHKVISPHKGKPRRYGDVKVSQIMKNIIDKQVLIILILSITLPFLWFRGGFQLGAAESGLPFNNLKNHESIVSWAWAYPAVGNMTSVNVASWPTYLLLSQFEIFGIAPHVIQSVFFSFLIFVSGTGMYLLIKEILPKSNNLMNFMGVLFYMFNPFVMVNVWNRFLYTFIMFWSALPILLYLFILGIRKGKLRYAVLVSLISILFSFAFTSIISVIILWSLFIYTIVFNLFYERKKFSFLITYLIITFIGYLTIHSWWIGQMFTFTSSSAYYESKNVFFSPQGNIATLNALSERLGKLTYILRFWHRDFLLFNNLTWLGLYNFPITKILEYSLSGFIIWTLYHLRKEKIVIYWGLMFVLALYLIKGNATPLGEVYNILFIHIGLFQLFRNPFEKLGLLYILSSTIIFVIGLNYVIHKKQTLFYSKFIIAILSLTIFLWSYPFVSSGIFQSASQSDADYKVKVPSYYYQADLWFRNNADSFRFLSLPISGEGITYNWNKQYSGIEPSSTLFATSNISFSTTIPYFDKLASSIVDYQADNRLFNFLPFINSKYLLVRRDINYKDRAYANPKVLDEKINTWENNNLIRNIISFGDLQIFEINDNYVWSKIFIADRIISSNLTTLDNISYLLSNFPIIKSAFVSNESVKKRGISYDKLVLYPQAIISQKVITPMPKDLSDIDILAKLFYAEHLPGEPIYPFIRLKEKIEVFARTDSEGLLLRNIGLLGKRSAEIYKLRKQNKNKNIILRVENDYNNQLKKLYPQIIGEVKTNTPVSKVVRDSLIYQWILFQRSQSNLTDKLEDLLVLWGVHPKYELPISDFPYVVFNFDFPKSGDYKFISDLSPEAKSIFVDGHKVKYNLNEDKLKLRLDEGQHEIALETESKNIIIPKLTITDEFSITDSNQYESEINLPATPTTYRISFDFKKIEGSKFLIKFVQDINNDESPLFSQIIQNDKSNPNWRSWSYEFKTSAGASKGYIQMTAINEILCHRKFIIFSDCRSENMDFNYKIRNYEVSEIRDVNAYILSDENFKDITKTNITWQKINPSLYKINVNKVSNDNEIIVFSELFNSGWVMEYEDGLKLEEKDHLFVNTYANGWIINRSGDYSLKLYFYPQSILDKTKVLSFISLIFQIFIIIYIFIKKL